MLLPTAGLIYEGGYIPEPIVGIVSPMAAVWSSRYLEEENPPKSYAFAIISNLLGTNMTPHTYSDGILNGLSVRCIKKLPSEP